MERDTGKETEKQNVGGSEKTIFELLEDAHRAEAEHDDNAVTETISAIIGRIEQSDYQRELDFLDRISEVATELFTEEEIRKFHMHVVSPDIQSFILLSGCVDRIEQEYSFDVELPDSGVCTVPVRRIKFQNGSEDVIIFSVTDKEAE